MKNSLVLVQFVILLVTISEVNCKKSKEDGKTALEHLIMKKLGKMYQVPKNIPKWVLDKVPFFSKQVYVLPMENPDLNPFAMEEVYQAPTKTVP